MVEKVKLDAQQLKSESQSILGSKLNQATLKKTPKDVQEDVIREYIQAKSHGSMTAQGPDGEQTDYNQFVEDRANGITQNIIEQIDRNGYSTWQDAIQNEVIKHYRKTPVENSIQKFEKDINKHIQSVDLTSVLGSKAQEAKKVTISSLETLGKILRKIVRAVGAKSVWLIRQLVESGLKTGRLFGMQMALFGSFALVFGSLFIGGAAGPMVGLRVAGYFTAFIATGVGLRFSCEALAEKLGIRLGML